MPRKSRKEEIIEAIREYLVGAVKRLEPITDERLMKAASCARATYYNYVTKGSVIESEIEVARRKQKKYAKSVKASTDEIGNEPSLRKRLVEAEEGNRRLLALIAKMIANLTTKYGVPANVVQAAQLDKMPHPDRRLSHAGRGRRKH